MTELEKWANCHKEVVLIKEFLDFASTEGNAELMTLVDSGEGFRPKYLLTDETKLINKFFGIDEKKLEEERRNLLDKCKAYQEKLENNKLPAISQKN